MKFESVFLWINSDEVVTICIGLHNLCLCVHMLIDFFKNLSWTISDGALKPNPKML